MDKYDFYERCVQSPEDAVRLLVAIHGRDPKILGEDFSGTAAVSRCWVQSVPGGAAVRHCDVMDADDPADLIFVGNFSIGEIHTRLQLVHYLRHARRRLNPGGVFVCDTYGGESAFLLGTVERLCPGPEVDGRPTTIRYTWQQREADPLTGRVTNALHFRVECGDEIIEQFHDTFVYDWRLWSVPELRDAMHEAGFAQTQIYAQLPDAVDEKGAAHVRPIEDPDELDESFIVCVVGRTDPTTEGT